MNDTYIKPLKLGHLHLPTNLVQAPLAGYSCAPFRVLTHRYGKPGFCATEMISSVDLVNRRQHPKRYLWRDPSEGYLCYQLSGHNVDILQRATRIVDQASADIIDLNCGCPVAKIRAKNSGSKLLATPEKIHALVTAIKANTDAVVSIKIRVAGEYADHDDFAVIDAAESAGVDFITVHGRHWRERYDVTCRVDDIARIVKKAKVPIIANGDIEDATSFKSIMEQTQCAGVMIARASVGRPWLFQQITAACENKTFTPPSYRQIGEIFLEHIKRLIELSDEKLAVLQSRKLAKYYARSLPQRKEFVCAMQCATSLAEAERLVDNYFGPMSNASRPVIPYEGRPPLLTKSLN